MSKYAKAFVGAIIAGLATTQVALTDNIISNVEWIQIVSAVVAALGLIWAVPNIKEVPPVEGPVA